MFWNEARRTTGILLLLLGTMLLLAVGLGWALRNDAVVKLLFLGIIWLIGGVALISSTGLRGWSWRGWFAGDPFLMATYCWGLASILGSIPYWLAVPELGWGDALFESVAGFTGTAASLWSSDKEVPEMLIWWRGSSQWLGGLGGILLIQGLLPLMGLERRGSKGRGLEWSFNQLAAWVAPVYVGGTVFLTLLLIISGLSLWEAGAHAMATISTGGLFGRLPADLGAGGMWLLTLGMWFGGMNFILLGVAFWGRWWVINRKIRKEWFWYGAICVLVALLFAVLWISEGFSLERGLREGLFHVISILSTTGYSDSWAISTSSFMLTLSLVLMWVGACTYSAGSGVRLQRVILMGNHIREGILQILHPMVVSPRDGEYTENYNSLRDLGGVLAFLLLHLSCWFVFSLLLTIDGHTAFGALASVLSLLNNVGPAFGAGGDLLTSWQSFSGVGKTIAIIAMLVGKIEVVTVCALLFRRGLL